MALPKLELRRGQLVAVAAFLGVLFVVGGLAWAFGQQFVLSARMKAEEQRLGQLIETEQARQKSLQSQLDEAQSDEYVERWARVEAKMVRPGEVLVVPAEDARSKAWVAPQPVEQAQQPPDPWWIQFLQAVLGPLGNR